jgi:hypothetical protein
MTEPRAIPGTVARAACQQCGWRGPKRRTPDDALADAAAHRSECRGPSPTPVVMGIRSMTARVASKLKLFD